MPFKIWIRIHYHFIWIPMSSCLCVYVSSDISAPLQVLEEDSGPASALRRLRRLSLLLLLQRKAWDETLHFNAAWLLCSQRHLAHCCQGQGIFNTLQFLCYELMGITLIWFPLKKKKKYCQTRFAIFEVTANITRSQAVKSLLIIM